MVNHVSLGVNSIFEAFIEARFYTQKEKKSILFTEVIYIFLNPKY